jgi:hypothetical protein
MIYDLLLKNTKLSSDTTENNEILEPIHKIYFVICNSCYWCASYFGIDEIRSLSQALNCHACSSPNVELILTGADESFRMEYDHHRGMELEFYKNNK